MNVHKKCAFLLASDCLITADGALMNARAGMEQMSITEQHQTFAGNTQVGAAGSDLFLGVGEQQQQQQQLVVPPPAVDVEMPMIPLGRLPGN